MGYTTDFMGEFFLNHPLTPEHRAYLTAFAGTRRMRRNAAKTKLLPDPLREAVKLPLGTEGAYFVGSGEDCGQTHTEDISDYNRPPSGQPGLWCQWVPDEAGTHIEWDGSEKFYDYISWIKYLIKHFLEPWGYALDGEVEWEGEESDDRGMIVIVNNKVTTKRGRIVYDEDTED